KKETIYHVQFFGTVQRGWTSPGSSFLFRGEKAYWEKVQLLEKTNPNIGPKSLKKLKLKYDVPLIARNKWTVAVKKRQMKPSSVQIGKKDLRLMSTNTTLKRSLFLKVKLLQKFLLKVLKGNSVAFLMKYVTYALEITLIFFVLEREDLSCFNGIYICFSSRIDSSNCGSSRIEIIKFRFKSSRIGTRKYSNFFGHAPSTVGFQSLFFCFICKNSAGIMHKCIDIKCRNHFHDECLAKYEIKMRSKRACSRHICSTCEKDNSKKKAGKGTI
ncbi:hypothetical protein CEXT_356362, partial [Caerostris extrusa]